MRRDSGDGSLNVLFRIKEKFISRYFCYVREAVYLFDKMYSKINRSILYR